MIDIHSFTLPELEESDLTPDWKPYRARQLYTWLWRRGVSSFNEMTDISKDMRSTLTARYSAQRPQVIARRTDDDGTRKFTFRLADGLVVESVYIPEKDRRTVCVSTQVGCPLNCGICYTARLGFKRNLTWSEIAGQVLDVRALTGTRISNVVFMGMGEPFLNYTATVTAIRELNRSQGLCIGARRMTVSTAGIPDQIRRYAGFPLQAKLAVSLNAADNATRDRLMPINHKHPLEQLMPAVREFVETKGKRVTFEYVLIDGVNDRPEDAVNLTRLLAGIPCKVNLIPFNPFPGCEFESPDDTVVERFAESLYPGLPAVTIRRSRGASIRAACGQLAGPEPGSPAESD